MVVFGILFIIIIILLFPVRWVITFSKNKSKIQLDVYKEHTINFKEKYFKLAQKHDDLYKKTRKGSILLLFLILAFVSLFMVSVSIVFILVFFVLIIGIAIAASSMDESSNKKKLNKEYIKKLYKDIIFKNFNVVKQKCSELEADDEFDYEDYEHWEEYYENQKNIIKDIMKKFNKKCYEDFSIKFDFDCEIRNRLINIKKIENYIFLNNGTSNGANNNHIYSFIGHIVTIPNFTKIEELNSLNGDYYYDKQKDILYLMISDERKNFFIACSDNEGMPNYNKPFDKCNWLKIKYNYYIQLRNLIERLV